MRYIFSKKSFLGLAIIGIVLYSIFHSIVVSILVLISCVMTLQGLLSIFMMIYAWNEPDGSPKNKSPLTYEKPAVSFSAVIPLREENEVIYDTLHTISQINYPEELKEVIIVCHISDTLTIAEVQRVMKILSRNNFKLITYENGPINKPRALNVGLQHVSMGVVVIFDAEDEPHKDIFNIANTIIIRQKADVVQSGVQIMNVKSKWFSALNVLEYFFWYKSMLHYFGSLGVTPLGGNTVFIKKTWIDKVAGWDETVLTEDAEIGIRLSLLGAKTKIVYDEQHVTKEEAPISISELIKQRTRWNQGFMQIVAKFPSYGFQNRKQKIISLYIFAWQFIQCLFILYSLFSILLALFSTLPPFIVLFSIFPLYIFFIQQLFSIIALKEFAKAYNIKLSFWTGLIIAIMTYPYYFILVFCSIRAACRFIKKNSSWEKTVHLNKHRLITQDISFPVNIL